MVDIDFQIVGFVGILPAPDLRKQALVSQNPPHVLDKTAQDFELDGRELTWFSVNDGPAALLVHCQPLINYDHSPADDGMAPVEA